MHVSTAPPAACTGWRIQCRTRRSLGIAGAGWKMLPMPLRFEVQRAILLLAVGFFDATARA